MKHFYKGATHIHTTYSDGTSDIPTIAKAAKKAGLKWIIISDHNTLKGISEEGWHEGVAVIVGNEISPDDSDHYLAFDVKEEISPDQPPQEYVKKVKELGGIGFVAHPDESNERKSSHKPLRWTDWSIRGFDGIEIWNYLSDWTDNYIPKNALYNFFFRNKTLSGPSDKTLNWWDELNKEKENEIVPAIGSVDCHALKYNYFGVNVKIFPYKSNLKTITNILSLDNKLSDDFETAKKQILNAIKNGNNIISNLKISKNFPIFYAQNKEKRAFCGEKLELDIYSKLVLKLPKKALVRIIYDGQLIYHYETKELEFEQIDKGKYRIEAYYKNKPWFFTNPILIQ